MYYIILVIQFYLCLLCDSRIAPSNPNEELIVRGVDAQDEFRFAVALYYNGRFMCTATVISPTTIMTAAHCVVMNGEQQPPRLYYGIANIDRTAPQVRIEFSRFIVYPGYTRRNIDGDIAIMKTTSAIPLYGDQVKPVLLAGPDYSVDSRASVIGWGRTSRNDIPRILQYAPQRIVGNFFCSLINSGINENKICAKGFLFSGACNGDSGGPLFSRDSPHVQIGITSYLNGNLGCGFSPAVFTRVSQYMTFIKEAAEDSIYFVPT